MAKIQGRFNVSLLVPVDVVPDFPASGLDSCHFQIEGDIVTIMPLNITKAIPYPDGDYEPSRLTEIRVWINREIDLRREQEESLVLSADEEQKFEKILVKATEHFVTVIKNKTNQWDLDTRHPVHAYSFEYWLEDVQISTAWPMKPGDKRLPEYAQGGISLRPSDFQDELSQEMWQEVVAEVRRPAPPHPQDELLYDAKTFRSHMRYETSVLYAAIASELMLREACARLLKTEGGLSDRQCDLIVKMNIPQLFELMHELNRSFLIKYEDVRNLVELRNRIAHGRSNTATHQEANEAIGTAEHLKRSLAKFFGPTAFGE